MCDLKLLFVVVVFRFINRLTRVFLLNYFHNLFVGHEAPPVAFTLGRGAGWSNLALWVLR